MTGDIHALVWGTRLLHRRGASGFAIFPGSYDENKKVILRLATPLDDEDRKLMTLAGWQRDNDEMDDAVGDEYWTLDAGELHDTANALPLRTHVMLEEEQERKDFGFNPLSPYGSVREPKSAGKER